MYRCHRAVVERFKHQPGGVNVVRIFLELSGGSHLQAKQRYPVCSTEYYPQILLECFGSHLRYQTLRQVNQRQSDLRVIWAEHSLFDSQTFFLHLEGFIKLALRKQSSRETCHLQIKSDSTDILRLYLLFKQPCPVVTIVAALGGLSTPPQRFQVASAGWRKREAPSKTRGRRGQRDATEMGAERLALECLHDIIVATDTLPQSWHQHPPRTSHNINQEDALTVLTCALKIADLVSSDSATAGSFGASAFSRMARARSHSGQASSRSPWNAMKCERNVERQDTPTTMVSTTTPEY